MKNIISLMFAAVLATTAFAQTPTESLKRIQAEVPTGDVQAFFEKSVTVGGTTFRQPWEPVWWNYSSKTVTVDGKTMTYAEVMQFVVAIANQEWAERKQAEALAAQQQAQPQPKQ